MLADGRVGVETISNVAIYLATEDADALRTISLPNGLPDDPQTVYELYQHLLRRALNRRSTRARQ